MWSQFVLALLLGFPLGFILGAFFATVVIADSDADVGGED